MLLLILWDVWNLRLVDFSRIIFKDESFTSRELIGIFKLIDMHARRIADMVTEFSVRAVTQKNRLAFIEGERKCVRKLDYAATDKLVSISLKCLEVDLTISYQLRLQLELDLSEEDCELGVSS